MPKVTTLSAAAYPELFKQYQSKKNFEPILEVIANEFGYLFDLEALELAVKQKKTKEPYFQLFDFCIPGVTDGMFTDAEIIPCISKKLQEYYQEKMFASKVSSLFYYVPDTVNPSKKQIGFHEKFLQRSLGKELDNPENLKQFAFTTLDMIRSAKVYGEGVVVELDHLKYGLDYEKQHLFIRSSSGDQRGLSQWILVYFNSMIKFLNLQNQPHSDLSRFSVLQ